MKEDNLSLEMSKVYDEYKTAFDKIIDNNLFLQMFLQHPVSVCENFKVENMEFAFGASRFCAMLDNSDYVIKCDLYSEWNDRFEYNKKELELWNNGGKFQKYLTPCTYIGTYHYCVDTYDYSLLDMDYVIDYGHYIPTIATNTPKHTVCISIDMYAYKKAIVTNIWNEYTKTPDSRYVRQLKATKSPLAASAPVVAQTFIDYYGKTEFEDFSNWLREENVNDIHRGNVGIIDGRFVLIDYCGFHD